MLNFSQDTVRERLRCGAEKAPNAREVADYNQETGNIHTMVSRWECLDSSLSRVWLVGSATLKDFSGRTVSPPRADSERLVQEGERSDCGLASPK